MSDLGTATGRIRIDVSDVKRAQREVQSASQSMKQALNTIGIGVGVREIAQFALEADKVATAYRRQSVAAANLAGSQAKLNELLSVYGDAMGGSVSKAEAMVNVTKLMSVGFADNAAEIDKFARAIRGISIAMGTTEDTVTQNLILELFTQRGARLDQLGLQYDKVRARADELRAADKQLTAQQAYQNAVLEQAKQRFGALTDSVAGQKTEVEKLSIAWKDFQLQIGQTAGGPINFIAAAMSNWLKTATADLEKATEFLMDFGQAIGVVNRQLLLPSQQRSLQAMDARDAQRRNRGQGSGVDAPRFTTEQEEAITDFYKSSMDAERDAHNERLTATVEYESQRTQTIRDFGKSMAREEQDFAIARARNLRDYERSVLAIMRDAQKREAKAQADLAETIAEARAKSAERLQDIEQNYNRARERAAESYGKSLRDAAGRLDAKRISELQDDYRAQEKERTESYNEQLDKERANLAESIAEAQKAHAERLTDARNADAERLADMRLNRALQLSDEDADRATRKARAFADHNDQLAEMDRLHAERMAQISKQLADEKARLKEGLDEFLGLQKDATEQALQYYTLLAAGLKGLTTLPGSHPADADPYANDPSIYDNSAYIMPQANNNAATGTGGGTSSLTMAPTIQIFAASSQSPNDIAAAVRREMTNIYRELSR